MLEYCAEEGSRGSITDFQRFDEHFKQRQLTGNDRNLPGTDGLP